jgi:hypothetical protein
VVITQDEKVFQMSRGFTFHRTLDMNMNLCKASRGFFETKWLSGEFSQNADSTRRILVLALFNFWKNNQDASLYSLLN